METKETTKPERNLPGMIVLGLLGAGAGAALALGARAVGSS
jgi:hypothetical protein